LVTVLEADPEAHPEVMTANGEQIRQVVGITALCTETMG
jgi:hypothetical protein